jgi:beta-aspartyl-peptidase (threonine type)
VKPSIAVHGGAWNIPADAEQEHIRGCERAAQIGYELLQRGAGAVEAVVESVACMEDDPTFDAGKGSVLNQSGQVEMDAMVMDGRTLRSGAVAALRRMRNPIRVAQRLMETTEFSMVAGEGALKFAIESGFTPCTEEDLLVGAELEDYREFLRTGRLNTRTHFSGQERNTVGACAVDSACHVASATSTGGTPRKIAGRIGDSPLVGSGAYADDAIGATSATGWGEKILAVVLSKTALDILSKGGNPDRACEVAIDILATRVDGFGGLIMVDRTGRIGCHHNTPKMAFAFAEGASGKRSSGIKRP